MPVIFRYDGVEYRVWSNDHNPAHVHVRPAQKRPEWEIIVFLGRERDGGTDTYDREFGDTKIVKGKIKILQINDLILYLDQQRDKAWDKWKEING